MFQFQTLQQDYLKPPIHVSYSLFYFELHRTILYYFDDFLNVCYDDEHVVIYA
jgi:hypothetical protein